MPKAKNICLLSWYCYLYLPLFIVFMFLGDSLKAELRLNHHDSVYIDYGSLSNFSKDGFVVEVLDSQATNFSVEGDNLEEDEHFFVTFSHESLKGEFRHMGNGEDKLKYNLFFDENLGAPLFEIPRAQSFQVISGTVEAGKAFQQIPLDYVLAIPQGQLVPSGTYRDQVTIRLYKGKIDEDFEEIESQKVDYIVHYPSLLRLSIGDSTQIDWEQDQLSLHFSELQEKAKRQFTIQVESNTSYALEIQSKNKGNLLPNFSKVEVPSSQRIPYTFQLEEKTIDLSKGMFKIVESLDKRKSGINKIIGSILIENFDYKMAGEYQDTIHLIIKGVN